MKKRSICWKITTNCNGNCRYCHRFLNVEELEYEKNEKILRKLITEGITDISWNGGEALLYPNLIELLKIAKENKVKNKIITNGIILAKNDNIKEVYDYLDCLTLSIDTVDVITNEEMGRGKEHFNNIKKILDDTKNMRIKLDVNTVISRKNINQLNELGEFLSNYKINMWKFFKFMPLRETALKNKEEFDISEEEFINSKSIARKFTNIHKIYYKEQEEWEESNVLILPNGDIVKTENGKDIKMGNALYDNIMDFMPENQDNIDKIRVLIAHDNERITNEMIGAIKKISYAEVIGISKNGEDTYNKIVNLKPEMVFTKFDFNEMNGLDIIRKSKDELKSELPIFNLISNRIPEEDLKEVLKVAGYNFNSIIEEYETFDSRFKSILNEYKNFKWKENN